MTPAPAHRTNVFSRLRFRCARCGASVTMALDSPNAATFSKEPQALVVYLPPCQDCVRADGEALYRRMMDEVADDE